LILLYIIEYQITPLDHQYRKLYMKLVHNKRAGLLKKLRFPIQIAPARLCHIVGCVGPKPILWPI